MALLGVRRAKHKVLITPESGEQILWLMVARRAVLLRWSMIREYPDTYRTTSRTFAHHIGEDAVRALAHLDGRADFSLVVWRIWLGGWKLAKSGRPEGK